MCSNVQAVQNVLEPLELLERLEPMTFHKDRALRVEW